MYKESFWSQNSHNYVHDGFVHQKLISLRGLLRRQKQGVQVKQIIIQKIDGLNQSGQCSFWFKTNNNRKIFSKIGTISNLIMQIDNGIGQVKNINHNIFGGFQFNKTFTQRFGFLGGKIYGENWSSQSIINYNFMKGGTDLLNKLNWKHNKGYIQGYMKWNLNNWKSEKVGLLGCFSNNQSSKYYLKIQEDKIQKLTFKHLASNIILTYINSVNQCQTLGIQTKIDFIKPKQLIKTLWLASSWKWQEKEIKARLSKDMSAAIMLKHKLSQIGWYSVGFQATEIGSKNRVKFGIQVDLDL